MAVSLVPLEIKQNALVLFRQGLRARKISQILNLDRSRVKEWQYLYDGGDTSWVSDEPVNRAARFSGTQRDIIVRAYLNYSLTMADLCRTFLLSKSMLKQWVRRYQELGAFTNDLRTAGNPGTEKAIEDFRAEKQILGNPLKCFSGVRDRSSKKKILRAIEQGRSAGLTVTYMLQELKLGSSTYYKWTHEPECRDDPALIAKIREIQERENYNIGYVRMSHLLEREGFPYKVNPKKTLRIMREQNLQAKQRVRKHPAHYYRKMKEKATSLPKNILGREFSSPEPGRKLVTDITYLPVKEGWCYAAAVKDLFNNEIVACSFARNLSVAFVKSVVLKLKENYSDLTGVLLHSDMGWTYTNRNYVALLDELRVIQSLSRKGNCWDNASMENFFGLMKTETIYRLSKSPRNLSYNQMVELVENYIYNYNHNRISGKLNWMTPVEYRESQSLNN